MANVRAAVAAQNAMFDALVALINLGSGPGTLNIYDGVQPATADTAITTQTLLATLTFSDPAAPAADDGSVTFSVIAQDSSADASSDATWARIQDSDGNVVFDCDCGPAASDAALKFNTVEIKEGGPVVISSFTLRFEEN